MHKIQQELLRVAQEKNLGQYTLREIGSFIGETSPQKVKHHLLQLESKGLIRIDKSKGLIKKNAQEWQKSSMHNKLLSIPILGSASAGPALMFAETNVEGYLKISSSLLSSPVRKEHRLFAIKVVGPSMNRAEINGKRIENGDYVIVDINEKTPKNGDIVLSIIDGMANIKKFYFDKEYNQVVLMSQSTKDFPHIYIHPEDDFMINGKVVQVIKTPRF